MNAIKLFLGCLPFFVTNCFGQLQAAKIFSNNMVLQRDTPIHVWGKNIPLKKIIISFNKEQKEVITNNDSSWSAYFSAQKANAKPQVLTIISGNEKVQLENILIGDVWICSGQSTWSFP